MASLAGPAGGAVPEPVPVRRNTPPGLEEASFLRREDPGLPIVVTLALDLRDRAGAEALTAAQHDPRSPLYNKWILPEEFQARFGPRPEDVQAAADFLLSRGFTDIEMPAARIVSARGTVGLAETAFKVAINAYAHGGREVYANDGDPLLPPELAGKVVRVGGLDSLTVRKPSYVFSGNPYYTHRDWANAYNQIASFDAGFKAEPGVTIAIAGAYQVETPLLNDIFTREGGAAQGYNTWSDGASGPRTVFQGTNGPADNPPGTCVVKASVQGSKGCTLQNGTNGDSLEAQLDSVMISSTANDAHLVNYMVNNLLVDSFTVMYQFIADQAADIKVVSSSWGLCVGQTPDTTIANDEAAFLQADAAGQAWFLSSGDRGSNDCGGSPNPDTEWPASSAHVTGAGGSDMDDNFGADGFNAGYAPEIGCSDGGGGVPSKSGSLYDRPAWQTGPGVPAGTKRVVPDISAHYGQCGGSTRAAYAVTLGSFIYQTSGTSAVAPMWAGAWAVGNQIVGQSMGHAAPLLYRILRSEAGTSYAQSFHDITSGSNGAFTAGPGYDPVTGIGTPDWGGLYASLQTLFSPSTGDLQGMVADASTSAPIAGAQVTTSGAASNATTTDGAGHYVFAGLPGGVYDVTVTAPGYTVATASGVVVAGGATTTQNFALTAAPPAGCLVDTTQGDFQSGVPTGLDLTSSPGDVKLAIASGGTETLDQQNINVGSTGNTITTTSWQAQTFVPALAGTLTRADLDLFCSGCSGASPDITVEVRTTSGGLPTSTVLATSTIAGFTDAAATFHTATFGAPATLASGTTYAIVLRLTTNRATGNYAALRSNNNQYAGGSQVVSTNSGVSWASQGTDLGFKTFMTTSVVYGSAGDLVSRVRDANPAAGATPHWTSLAWTATTPAGTSVRFQAAASNSLAGPFAFIGPDGTSATFFTTSPASLSGALFSGRYLKYRAFLGTTVGAVTPILSDVTACYDNSCGSPPAEVTPVLFSSQTVFGWPVPGSGAHGNSYRGTIPAGLLGSRSPAARYDQICYESADALADGSTASTDASTPPPGTAFYYLVTEEGACGEGPLGFDSSSQAIPNTSPCPTPP
ncbi:MAG TPA: protease pro-enzyme activation domain-containing protein [Candidatus Polarisedimenticolia bacterium]|nr:protease pro-enzyme activation domain-containing protein [Candidatus Polarisedimenticolia bacterium]